MAWNPIIPTVTNRVQDDLNAIRENFQHLDPLAQVVGELQTVSGLAQAVDELQAVSALAPYVQALLDSRIVEMGSNSNGEYVRWENGLQVCWHRISHLGSGSSVYGTETWTFPAAFSNVPTCSFGQGPRDVNETPTTTVSFTVHAVSITTSRADTRFIKGSTIGSNERLHAHVFAVGRWS